MNKIVKIVLFFLLSMSTLNAIGVEVLLKDSIENVSDIKKSKLILSKKELLKVKKIAKTALKSRLYRFYKVKSNHKLKGYAILISRKVRSKKATVLYFIDTKANLLFTEILAFLEPPEFKPNSQWLSQFKNRDKSIKLKVGEDIPTITGATLSARNIADGARVARTIFEVKLK